MTRRPKFPKPQPERIIILGPTGSMIARVDGRAVECQHIMFETRMRRLRFLPAWLSDRLFYPPILLYSEGFQLKAAPPAGSTVTITYDIDL